jgi:hypothetical protein
MKTNEVRKIEVENVNHPGQFRRVDAAKYATMRDALLRTLPTSPPGLTVAESLDRLVRHLSNEDFPGGDTAGWWLKTVQLDLEAKGVVVRTKTSPLRLYRC